jgi:hypothetical protein
MFPRRLHGPTCQRRGHGSTQRYAIGECSNYHLHRKNLDIRLIQEIMQVLEGVWIPLVT